MKTKQKVRNWKDYNESLKARGRIIFTLDEESIKGLYFEGNRKPGGVQAYTDKMYEYLSMSQWRKLHVALDLKSMEIVSMSYTQGNVNDCEEIENLLKGIKDRKIESITGDGVYDTHKMYELGDRLKFQKVMRRKFLGCRTVVTFYLTY